MSEIPATEFKAKCLESMDRVSERRETFVITKHGRPVARLVPVVRSPEEPLFRRLRGMAEEVGDIVAPVLPPEAWAVLQAVPALPEGKPGAPASRPVTRRRSRPARRS